MIRRLDKSDRNLLALEAPGEAKGRAVPNAKLSDREGWETDIHTRFLRELIGCSCIAGSRSVKHAFRNV
jgi:hypothetical protein